MNSQTSQSLKRSNEIPRVLDCTLRDGSYVSDFYVGSSVAAMIMDLLASSGCYYVEIGHGLGAGAARALSHDLPLSDTDWYGLAREHLPKKDVGCFILPDFARQEDVEEAAAGGLSFIRVGVELDAPRSCEPFVEAARRFGLKVFVNILKCERNSAEKVLDAARSILWQESPDGIYFVDSMGGLLPSHVQYLFSRAAEQLPIELGFHGHDNLQLAVANSIAASDAGADVIDVTLGGVGRGAGNTRAELFAAVQAIERGDGRVDQNWFHLSAAADSVQEAFRIYQRTSSRHLVACAIGELHTSRIPEILRLAGTIDVDPALLMADPALLNMPVQLTDAGFSQTPSDGG